MPMFFEYLARFWDNFIFSMRFKGILQEVLQLIDYEEEFCFHQDNES